MTVSKMASTIEGLYIEIEELNNLLQLYDEHREDELQGVSLDEPYTVAALLSRQQLGLALLRAVEDKGRRIQEVAKAATDEAYKAARATKGGEGISRVGKAERFRSNPFRAGVQPGKPGSHPPGNGR